MPRADTRAVRVRVIVIQFDTRARGLKTRDFGSHAQGMHVSVVYRPPSHVISECTRARDGNAILSLAAAHACG